MQKFSLIVESLEQAHQATQELWDKIGVRGEVELHPMDNSVRIDIVSEKDLTERQRELLPGKRNDL